MCTSGDCSSTAVSPHNHHHILPPDLIHKSSSVPDSPTLPALCPCRSFSIHSSSEHEPSGPHMASFVPYPRPPESPHARLQSAPPCRSPMSPQAQGSTVNSAETRDKWAMRCSGWQHDCCSSPRVPATSLDHHQAAQRNQECHAK